MMARKWVLGFAGVPRPQGAGEWYDTFIGGQQVFPEDFKVYVPACPLCAHSRTLVLQAFAPHISHPEREIYLFGCNSIKCALDTQSWFAMRLCKDTSTAPNSHKRDQENEGDASAGELVDTGGTIDWDTGSESDGSTSSDLVADLASLSLKVQIAQEDGGPLSSTTSKKTKEAIKTQNSTQSSTAAQSANKKLRGDWSTESMCESTSLLKSYYVEVAEEPERSELPVNDVIVDRLLNKYEREEQMRAKSGVAEAWGAEKEDRNSAASENFEVFHHRISRAPEQILRYCFDTEPIWPKHPPPQCQAQCDCGSPLVFEVQVLGSCLHYLQPDESVAHHSKDAGMNFAAIAVYTCQADCTSSEILAQGPSLKMLKQTVLIQQDEW